MSPLRKVFALLLTLLATPAAAQNTFFAASPGQMIYRGASGWAPVTAPLSSGQFLLSQGPTAMPVWTFDLSGFPLTTWQWPTIPTNRVLGNVSGGQASYGSITVNQVLDMVGYDTLRPPGPASLLYKDVTTGTWQALPPPTSSGFVLGSGGAAANPAWVFNPGSVTPGVAGTCLTSNGPTLAPSYQPCPVSTSNLTAVSPLSIAYGTPSIISLSGIVDVPHGGTGAATFTSGGVLYGQGTAAVLATAAGGASTVLTDGGGTPAFSGAPQLSTSLTTPLVIGGSSSGSTLELRGTSAVGGASPNANVNITTGNNGATRVVSFGAASTSNVAAQLGTPGTAKGSLLFSGNTSGTVTIQPQAAAGTFNFNLPITAGTAGQVLTSGGGAASPMTWSANAAVVAATQAEQEAGSSTTVYTSPGRQQFHPAAAKAWCLFDGTVVTSTTCIAGYNVSSISHPSTGNYSLNFTTAFSAATAFMCTGNAGQNASTGFTVVTGPANAVPTASTWTFQVVNAVFATFDPNRIVMVCYGDQ